MHRKEILSQLNEYKNQWLEEASTTERFIEFVSANEDCFERSLEKGHVTGSAWLVNKDSARVLLTHHKKLNRWLQLGGHADGDPDILNVAMREAVEESGLESVTPISDRIFDVDIHLIPERGNEPEHFHYDARYAMRTTGSQDYVVSDESHDLSWIDIRGLNRVTDEESMLRMGRKWLTLKSSLII